MAIITISRGTKSGGEILASCLADKLEYPLIGRELLQDAAAHLGVPPEDLVEKMEDQPRFFGRATSLRKTYIAAVRAALAEAAVDGDLVYHGLAGGLLLRNVPGLLKVRLIAPLEMRVEAVREGNKLDPESARQYIQEVDEARARWVKGMYGVDILDPAHYDLVLNLGTFSIPEACTLVCTAVGQPEFERTTSRRQGLDDFRVASQARLALADDMGTQTLELEATARGGVVEVSGQAPILNTGEVGNRIVEIVGAIDGVKDVVLKIEWFDPYP